MKPIERSASKKKKLITLELIQGQFPVVLYCNQFGTERIGSTLIVHIGLVRETKARDELLACFVFMLDPVMLDQQKEGWIDYLQNIGLPEIEEQDRSWRAPLEKIAGVPVVTAMQWSRRGSDAEIRCYNFAIGDVLSAEASTKVVAQPVALLVCPLELQRQLLLALYAELPRQ